MSRITRRSLLSNAAALLPGAGIFSLPNLARAIQTASTPQQRPRVKITDVRTAQVMVHGPQTHVRIYTEAGLYGQGESTDAAVGTASLVQSWHRLLVGQDPLNVDAIWERIRVGGIFAGAQGGPIYYRPDRGGNCVVGPCWQTSRPPRLPTARRQIPR